MSDSGHGDQLYVAGRDVVLSYLSGAAGAWEVEDDDVVESLTASGQHRRIRISVTEGPAWRVPWAFARAQPTVFPDGWWAFVRVRDDGRHELYLAAENEVRDLLYRIVTAPGFDDEHPELVEAEEVELTDADVHALARRWSELGLAT